VTSPADDDPRPFFLRVIDQLEQLAATVTPEQLAAASVLPGWDTRTLIGHIVGDIHRVAYGGEGGRLLDVAAMAGRIADDDWADAVHRARVRAAVAWADDAKLVGSYTAAWGQVTGAMALRGYVMELGTHTWDLVQSVDPAAELDDELGAMALAAARQIAPADHRDAGGSFGPVQPVPDDAGVYDQLAGWLGRKVRTAS
jgi:uncharacterized protein (TIGR03086 family)